MSDLATAGRLRASTTQFPVSWYGDPRVLAGFRERYFGYHPLAGAACWAVADPFGNPDPRWVRPGGGEHPT